MAVNKVTSSKTLAIEVQSGKDSKGEPTYSKKTFGSLKSDVDIQAAFDVADAIKGVLDQPTRAYFMNTASTLEVE